MDIQEMQEREIFLAQVMKLLRQKFPGSTLKEDGTLRDLCDAAFDVMKERLASHN